MSQLKVSEIVSRLNSRAPLETAESWDNVGLLAGDPEWKTPGAVVSIDLTERALETAIRKKYRLIVNHHPCIFPKSRGLSRIVAGPGSGMSGLVFEALRNGIAVAAYHTNFDKCALEVVKRVSAGLRLRPAGRLFEKGESPLVKLAVYVPSTHLESVREALCSAGAGQIGDYDSCTFAVEGQGTFRGRPGTRPWIGIPGTLEKAHETRLETIFPRGLEKQVLRAMKDSHPYEEIAYDLYPVEQRAASRGLISGLGYGFWGEFNSARPFPEVLKDVRAVFQSKGFMMTEPAPRRIKRVGFVAGKGTGFLDAAASVGCDLFITGEAGYHSALDGSRRKMAVMELGHRESERAYLSTMKGWIGALGLKSVELNIPTQKIYNSRG